MDFGADLNQWTGNLTSGDDVPMVHSVSYGWQVKPKATACHHNHPYATTCSS